MHLPSWILKRQLQNAEFKADISVCPMAPQPFLTTRWKSLQAKFRSPICWVEMDLSEVSKQEVEESEAQHTRLVCWRNRCQKNISSMLENQPVLWVLTQFKLSSCDIHGHEFIKGYNICFTFCRICVCLVYCKKYQTSQLLPAAVSD